MVIERQFIPAATIQSDRTSEIKVMTFNILAQGLSDGFIKCPSAALDFQHRLNLIVEEIITRDPDVLCLQEVDMFDQLAEKLRHKGFQGEWLAKLDSPCLESVNSIGPDGSAIFYKQHVLELEKCLKAPITIDSKPTNQVYILCKFHLKGVSHVKINVACLHLKAKGGFESIRAGQTKAILHCISEHAKDTPYVLVCGDLNSEPTEPAHDILRAAGYRSAYAAVLGAEPEYTTWKIRSHGEERKREDYIYFFSPENEARERRHLQVLRVLALPSAEQLGEWKLPNLTFPSDHLNLMAVFGVSTN